MTQTPGESPQAPQDIPERVYTSYDPTVLQRLTDRLERTVGPNGTTKYTGFILPSPESGSSGLPSTAPSVEVPVAQWWDIPGRARRYLRVVHAAGIAVLGEEARAREQARGTAGGYVRSSQPRTEQLHVEDVWTSVPLDPLDFRGDRVYKQMMRKTGHATTVNPDIPTTWRQRRAVRRIEQARRDASIYDGEIRAYKDFLEDIRKGHPPTRHDRRLRRGIRRYERTIDRRYRRIERIAEGRDIIGRIATMAALFGASHDSDSPSSNNNTSAHSA